MSESRMLQICLNTIFSPYFKIRAKISHKTTRFVAPPLVLAWPKSSHQFDLKNHENVLTDLKIVPQCSVTRFNLKLFLSSQHPHSHKNNYQKFHMNLKNASAKTNFQSRKFFNYAGPIFWLYIYPKESSKRNTVLMLINKIQYFFINLKLILTTQR